MTSNATHSTCPRCKRLFALLTTEGACLYLYAKCPACCTATQQQVNGLLIADNLTSKLSMQTKADTKPEGMRVFTVTVVTSKPIPDMTDHIGGRVWTMDGVECVTVTEET
jgi:hypothetical protein